MVSTQNKTGSIFSRTRQEDYMNHSRQKGIPGCSGTLKNYCS